MLNWLKRLFIPHVGNAYRPHFLLGENLRKLLGVILGVELILFVLPALSFLGVLNTLNLTAVLPGVLSTLTNEERAEASLGTLSVSPVLSHAAELKAKDMAEKSYFAHTSPEGRTPWYWLDQAGYIYSYAGENLAINFTDSKDVTDAWMNSPSHKANIINGNYTEMGTGIATGMYQGRETIFVVQVYARPLVALGQAPAQTTQKNALSSSADDVRSTPLVSVRDVFPEKSAPSPEETEVLGESAPDTAQQVPAEPTFVEKTLSSPRSTTSAILYVILALVIVALFLNVVIHMDKQHPDLITNGLAVAVIIFAIHLTNGYLSEKDLQTSFIGYENPAEAEL